MWKRSLLFALTAMTPMASGLANVTTPESYGPPGSFNLSNFDNNEIYEGPITIGESKLAFVTPAFGGFSLASMHWFKFEYDGVTPVILDTFGEDSIFGFGGGMVGTGGGNSNLAIFDDQGNFVVMNNSVRGFNEPYHPPVVIRPNQPEDAPPPPTDEELASRLRQTMNPLTDIQLNYQRNNGSQTPPAEGEEDTRFWATFAEFNNLSQIALLPGALSHPSGDPLLDWDQFLPLPAGTYFIAVSGGSTFAGNPANTEEQNLLLDSNESSDRNTPFGFYSIHPNSGQIRLNVRLAGDVNLDGVTDADDIDALFAKIRLYANDDSMLNGVQWVLDEDDNPVWAGRNDDFIRHDLSGNNRLDIEDVRFLVHTVLFTEFGDANLDGKVDDDDLALLQANLGSESGWASGDFSGDARVTLYDAYILFQNYGFERPGGGIGVTAIPEPISISLLAAGSMILLGRRRT